MAIYKAQDGKRIHSPVGVIKFEGEYYQTENPTEIMALEAAKGVEEVDESDVEKGKKVKKSNAKKAKAKKPKAKKSESIADAIEGEAVAEDTQSK